MFKRSQSRSALKSPVPQGMSGFFARPGTEQPVFGLDTNDVLCIWSGGAEEKLGRSRAAMIGQKAMVLFPPDVRQPWSHMIRHVLAGESVTAFPTCLLRGDGSRLDQSVDMTPIRDAVGGVFGVSVLMRDLPSSDHTLASGLDHDTWTRAVVDTATDGIITIDPTGMIEYVNPAAERLFGYLSSEVIGKPVDMLLDSPLTDKHGHYNQQGGIEKNELEYRQQVEGRSKGGETFPAEVSVVEVALGTRRLFTAMVHDISLRKRAQEEKDQLLRDLNKRNIELTCLYQTAETTQSHELLSDVFQEVVRLICPAFLYPAITRCRITFDGDRYVSSPFSATPWRLAGDIAVAGRKRGELEVFYLAERPERSEGPFLREERELIDAITNTLVFTIERREADAQVIQASKLASIGELAAGVGHEINNPVNGIINCADILSRQFDTGTQQRQFADLIGSEAERIATIVRNLLTFARQDREHYSPARMIDIVEVVLSLSRKKIEKSRIRLEVDVPEELPSLRCRSEQLQQVLMNLIINALHALDQRYRGANPDKTLYLFAEEITLENRPAVRLTVEDHGCGIDPAHIERLFDPFFTTKGRDVGTGLGLSISSAIVREHGGQITVESELGRFSRFRVDLPLSPPATLPAHVEHGEG